MTLYQFNLLNETQQAETLWDNGVHIGERVDEEYTVAIYQVHNFCVEVFYHKGLSAIKKFRSFPGADQLAPYTANLDISDRGS
jgi:hypothetical protein